jgi:hypothetical protein
MKNNYKIYPEFKSKGHNYKSKEKAVLYRCENCLRFYWSNPGLDSYCSWNCIKYDIRMETLNNGYKICNSCELPKNLINFRKNDKKISGYMDNCKLCEYIRNNKGKIDLEYNDENIVLDRLSGFGYQYIQKIYNTSCAQISYILLQSGYTPQCRYCNKILYDEPINKEYCDDDCMRKNNIKNNNLYHYFYRCKNCSKIYTKQYRQNKDGYCSIYCTHYDLNDIILSIGFKKCCSCKEEKDLKKFGKLKKSKDGFNSRCRKCSNMSSNKPEYLRRAAKKTRERMQNDPEYRKRRLFIRREWEKERYINDPKYKLDMQMRKWMNGCLHNMNYCRYCESFVDYTKAELRSHFENLFKDGMSWSNYGQWEVDHIKPRSSFNYTNPKDFSFKECWSLSNLQPLWKEDNLSKGVKFTE